MEYQVTVDQFTGPLDLLLHLIKEHDMDLLDLDVAAVCDQYLAYIQTMDPSLLEAVSEYLVMAAWLIEMKSKLLLPKPEIDEEDDYEAERKRMIERLIEKNRINGILEAFEASMTNVRQCILKYLQHLKNIFLVVKKLFLREWKYMISSRQCRE